VSNQVRRPEGGVDRGAAASAFGRGRTAFSRSLCSIVASSSRPGWSAIRGAPSARRRCRPTSPTSSATAGVTRDGEKGRAFGAAEDRADAVAFARRRLNDRHHFRFVVTPEDGAEMTDLKAFTRDLAVQMESDLGTRLDWVGVAHWNTDNPHVHLVVRGVADDGSDLVISRDYISHGLRWRAADLVSAELGPRPDHEIRSALAREVEAERWRRLDAAIRMAADNIGFIDLGPDNPGEGDPQARRLAVGRLQKLERMGLATAAGPGQ
jgi:type IV secretory pathway VirD2 relaxase